MTFRMFFSKTSNAHPSVNTKGVKQRVKKEFRNILTKWIVYILHIVSEQIVRQAGGQQHKTQFSKKDLKSVHIQTVFCIIFTWQIFPILIRSCLLSMYLNNLSSKSCAKHWKYCFNRKWTLEWIKIIYEWYIYLSRVLK